MNQRQARRVVERWVACNLLLGTHWGAESISDQDEERLTAAAQDVADGLLAKAARGSETKEVETRGTLEDIIDDVLKGR